MDRALREFRIRGVATNLAFLENVIGHPRFRDMTLHDALHRRDAGADRRGAAPRPRDEAPELHRRRDGERASRDARPAEARPARAAPGRAGLRRPACRRARSSGSTATAPESLRRLDARREARARHRHDDARRAPVAARDAHAHATTSSRSRRAYAAALPELLSLECWGGATFDVAMRFLTEDPWERLAAHPRARAEHPAADAAARRQRRRLHQLSRQRRALLRRAGGGGGHRPLPRLRLPELGREHARRHGRGAARPESSARRRSATPATSSTRRGRNTTSPTTSSLARELEQAGAHIIAVKDMAGVMKPAAARALFKALREEIGAPLHFHTHDTSGLAAATVLAAVEAGRRRHRRGDGFALRPDLAALPRLARRGARPDRPRDRPRPRGDPPDLALLGGGALPVPRLRERPPLRRLGGLPARNAGRAVHQPEGAGARARPGKPLARGGARLCRGEPAVRRHRQGHALLQGGRRHGADDGDAGAFAPPTCSIRRATSPSRIRSCR